MFDDLWPAQVCNIFRNYLLNGLILGQKKAFKIKGVHSLSVHTYLNFSPYRKNSAR
jgi:hypothetical protein